MPPTPRGWRLAEDRTVLAAERTFVAWLRTGLAFLGIGLAAQRFLREVLAVWPLKVLSLTLIACALTSFAGAVWRDRAIRARLAHSEIPMMPRLLTIGIAALLIAIAGLAATALLWA
ncbi:YidH family protein [Methylobacterium oryzae CBMB20]